MDVTSCVSWLVILRSRLDDKSWLIVLESIVELVVLRNSTQRYGGALVWHQKSTFDTQYSTS